MAHLWIASDAREWTSSPLTADQTPDLTVASPADGTRAALVRWRSAGPGRWLLLAPGGAPCWINGRRVVVGIHLLEDRDEIRWADAPPAFFSTESLARVAAAPSEGPALSCPRCKLDIEAGSPAVRCPVCGVWHHQNDRLPCWTYAPHCAMGEHRRTVLPDRYSWKPEPL